MAFLSTYVKYDVLSGASEVSVTARGAERKYLVIIREKKPHVRKPTFRRSYSTDIYCFKAVCRIQNDLMWFRIPLITLIRVFLIYCISGFGSVKQYRIRHWQNDADPPDLDPQHIV